MQQEIEIKIPVSEITFKELSAAFSSQEKARNSKRQLDVYLDTEQLEFTREKYPYKWLRIRYADETSTITFKHFYPEGIEKHSHCDEFQIKVNDLQQALGLFSELGYKEIARVTKTREEIVDGDITIAFDEVEELGYFIELEIINNNNSNEVGLVRDKLNAFAISIGLDPKMADYRGYPYRVMEKNGLLK